MVLNYSIYLHGLNLFSQFGPARLALLNNYFENFKKAFEADLKSLEQAGIDNATARSFLQLRKKINLEEEAEKLEKNEIKLLDFKDSKFPKLLLEIPKFPPLLYYKGIMEDNDELCVGVVGTRQITNYGRVIVPQITEPLALAGACIVSGLAFGVDALAHETCIKNNKRTIAVLGGGLDEKSLYPKHHAYLAKEILEKGGALISEYPIGTPNFKQNFVARNRIISGLSLGTIVVECDLKSGTLITAKHALEQNRTVFAVPGPIYSPQSQGPNNLLKMGAKPITEAKDVLEDLNIKQAPIYKQARSEFSASKEENLVLKIINFDPVSVDEIIKKSGLKASDISSTLTFLEMKGLIRNLGGQQYILVK